MKFLLCPYRVKLLLIVDGNYRQELSPKLGLRLCSLQWSPTIYAPLLRELLLSKATYSKPMCLPVFFMACVSIYHASVQMLPRNKDSNFLILIGSFYCVMLAICVLYSGIRLMRLLNHHLEMLGSGKRYELVKTGRLKVRDWNVKMAPHKISMVHCITQTKECGYILSLILILDIFSVSSGSGPNDHDGHRCLLVLLCYDFVPLCRIPQPYPKFYPREYPVGRFMELRWSYGNHAHRNRIVYRVSVCFPVGSKKSHKHCSLF